MLSLWCAGKLENCPSVAKTRFRFCCLYCRWRRKFYGRWTDPPDWIQYTYTAIPPTVRLVDVVVHNGVELHAPAGKKLKVTSYKHVWIDPRGHFTALRCAGIMIVDRIMKVWFGLVHGTKPFAEICEFLANYPTV